MTHQYRAEDFADLPKKALEALGIRDIGGNGEVAVINHKEFCEALPLNHAAAILLGMVQHRTDRFLVRHQRHADWECRLSLPNASLRLVTGPTPLSAVLSAYAAALEGKA